MSQKKLTQNTFSKGMYQDSHPGIQPDGTYTYCLNGKVNTDKNDEVGITNEQSTVLGVDGLGTVHGATLVDERNQWVVFTTDGQGSSVWLVDYETFEKTHVVSDSEFGCSWNFSECEYLYAEQKVMEPCSELFIYFSSNCKYYTLNVDALLDPDRRDCFECEDFCLFVCACVPQIDAKIASTAGGKLPSGTYQFVAQLEDEDGNTSNWFQISEKVSVDSPTNRANDISNRAIQVRITDLDPRYEKVKLAVIKVIGGETTSEIITERPYSTSGVSYLYYGQQGDAIQLEEILTKRRTYIEGQDLVQKDGRLYLYNIRQKRNLDWVQRGLDVQVSGLLMAVKAEDAWKYKTLSRGEKYTFGLNWNHCDGSKSFAYHIPAGNSVAAGAGNGDGTIRDISGQSNGATDAGTFTSLDRTLIDHRPDPVNDPDGDPIIVEDEIDNISSIEDTELSDLGDTSCLDCGEDALGDVVGDLFSEGDSDGDGNPDPDFFDPTDGTGLGPNIGFGRKGRKRKGKGIKRLGGLIDDALSQNSTEGNEENYKKDNLAPVDRPPNLINSLPTLEGNPDVHIIGDFELGVFESQELYPETKNCEGEKIYGDLAGTPIKLFEIPGEDELPFFISYANGVKSEKRAGADEWKDAYAIIIGLTIDNIEYPEQDELHTPLCMENPYSIVMAERDDENASIIAKGLATHTFKGRVNGREHAIPNHGVNSPETVDRYIQNDDDENHFGETNDLAIYNFHSADTCTDKPGLLVDEVNFPGSMFGTGWRHGQYAFGDDPGSTTVPQIDQRGTRQAVNLTDFTASPVSRVLTGISYAEGNHNVTNVAGMDLPLMNINRESSVVFQVEGDPLTLPVEGGITDRSFFGDGIDHSVPIVGAEAHYAVLKRNNPSQYGSVESMRYISTGLQAKKDQGESIQGVIGDVFIGPWTIKRTSYVSNKVGSTPIYPSRNRTSDFLRYWGFGDCTRPPDSGDTDDAKNLASLRPGVRWSPGLSGGPSNDTYYPRTLKTLVIFWGEFRVNPWLRATGIEEGEVFYDKLEDLELDSAINGVEWTQAWLNRFYCRVVRETKWQRGLRIFLRLFTFFAGIFLMVYIIGTINSLPDIFIAILRAIILIGIWVILFFFILTNRNINKMLGIKECLDDNVGGQDDSGVVQWEDNFCDYNYDHSRPNDLELAFGVPDPFNTCDCDDCINDETTNEIFISNKQVLGSAVDSYKNFQANAYNEFPGDHGRIVKIFTRDSRMYVHTTDTISIVSYKSSNLVLDDRNLFIGSGGLLTEPQPLFEGIEEGFGGLQRYTHSINTEAGYFFVDEKSRKIYRFSGLSDIEDVTIHGMRNFFRENIPICSDSNCKGENAPNEVGYTLGYDHRHNRFLFTKKDEHPITMSYDPLRKRWISFHSYVPQFYLWNRHNMYSLKDGAIWVHEQSPCDYQTFYGEYHPHIIEFSAKEQNLSASELNNIQFYTQANICKRGPEIDVYNQKRTFDKGIFYNNTQSTGNLSLNVRADGLNTQENLHEQIKDKCFEADIVWQGEEWRVNYLKDNLIDPNEPIWLKNSCSPDKVLNEANHDCSKPWFNSSILFDKYLLNRLIFHNFEYKNTQLITKYYLTVVNIPEQ